MTDHITQNHGLNTPKQGTLDWHIPLNENFGRLDTDLEVRDVESNRDAYAPKNGAKFFSTDTGKVYIGDGVQWNAVSSAGDTVDSFAITNRDVTVQNSIVVHSSSANTRNVYPISEYDDIAHAMQVAMSETDGPATYVMPTGVFPIRSTNHVPIPWAEGDTITGQGIQNTHIDMSGISDFLFARDGDKAKHWSFRDFFLKGDNTPGSGIIESRNNTRYLIQRVAAEDMGEGFHLIEGSWTGTLIECYVANLEGTGLKIDGDEVQVIGGEYRGCDEYNIEVLDGSSITLNTTSNDGGYAGINLHGSNGVHIHGCYFENNGTRLMRDGKSAPVDIACGMPGHSDLGAPTNVHIVGNHFSPIGGGDDELQTGAAKTYAAGILIGPNCHGVRVENNDFYHAEKDDDTYLVELHPDAKRVYVDGTNFKRWKATGVIRGALDGSHLKDPKELNEGVWTASMFHDFSQMQQFANDHLDKALRDAPTVQLANDMGVQIDGSMWPAGTTFVGNGRPSMNAHITLGADNQSLVGVNVDGGLTVSGDRCRVEGCSIETGPVTVTGSSAIIHANHFDGRTLDDQGSGTVVSANANVGQ